MRQTWGTEQEVIVRGQRERGVGTERRDRHTDRQTQKSPGHLSTWARPSYPVQLAPVPPGLLPRKPRPVPLPDHLLSRHQGLSTHPRGSAAPQGCHREGTATTPAAGSSTEKETPAEQSPQGGSCPHLHTPPPGRPPGVQATVNRSGAGTTRQSPPCPAGPQRCGAPDRPGRVGQ